jgi:hypothetical protein
MAASVGRGVVENVTLEASSSAPHETEGATLPVENGIDMTHATSRHRNTPRIAMIKPMLAALAAGLAISTAVSAISAGDDDGIEYIVRYRLTP